MKSFLLHTTFTTSYGRRNQKHVLWVCHREAVRQAKEVARLQKQIKGLLTDDITTEDM
jgi:hypothetical protein